MAACAPLFVDSPSWQPTPGTRIVQPDLQSSIGYYTNAVTAIDARHYALALEYLQAARAQKPSDARVLTAFGVVYDKLGRFDLSTRYYAQAAAVDPQSKIIAADIDYSRRLQGLATVDSATLTVLAGHDLAEGTGPRMAAEQLPILAEHLPAVPAGLANITLSFQQIAALAEANLLLKDRAGTPTRTKPIFLTGHPLMIVDASGHSDAGKSVQSYLSGLRWTVAKGELTKVPSRFQTVIFYNEPLVTAAKALARTLSLQARLTARSDAQGLKLVLGSDIAGTNLAGKILQPPQRQLALAVATGKRE